MSALSGRSCWFVGLYLASIAALALVTFVIKEALRLLT
jgi:hypothetical protein